LRVRLVSVPGVAFIPRAFVDSNTFQCSPLEQLTLPEERDLTPNEGSVGPVAPLVACSAEQVELCDVIIPAPQQLENCSNDFGFGFQVYAVLEQCDLSAAQCADPNLADFWIPVDSIRVTEGEWPFVGGVRRSRRGSQQ
jgi:hypothetical protein